MYRLATVHCITDALQYDSIVPIADYTA